MGVWMWLMDVHVGVHGFACDSIDRFLILCLLVLLLGNA